MVCLKCCPRCESGALYESGDMWGSYIACLHCGYYLTEAEEVVLRFESRHGSKPNAKEKPLAGAAFVGAAR
jgi:hypothetical protein